MVIKLYFQNASVKNINLIIGNLYAVRNGFFIGEGMRSIFFTCETQTEGACKTINALWSLCCTDNVCFWENNFQFKIKGKRCANLNVLLDRIKQSIL